MLLLSARSYQSAYGAALYVYVLVMMIGRVPLGAPLACVRFVRCSPAEFRMH